MTRSATRPSTISRRRRAVIAACAAATPMTIVLSSGVDGTHLLLGAGLLTFGAGSIVALLTRDRNSIPAL